MTPKMRASQSHHARQLLDAAQALKSLLPKPPPNGLRRIGRSAHLPVDFLEQCAVFFDEQPQIAQRVGMTSNDVRTMIARTAALGPVVAEIAPMAGELRAVLNQDRALVGSACLKAYDYAKSAARSLNDPILAEHASRMAQALNGRPKRLAKRATPSSATTTTTTTTMTTESSPPKQ